MDAGGVGEGRAEVVGEGAVEAGEQDPEPLGRQAAGLLRGEERLARAGRPGHRHPPVPGQHVEQAELLVRQAEDLPVGLGHVEGERVADLHVVGQGPDDRLHPLRPRPVPGPRPSPGDLLQSGPERVVGEVAGVEEDGPHVGEGRALQRPVREPHRVADGAEASRPPGE